MTAREAMSIAGRGIWHGKCTICSELQSRTVLPAPLEGVG